MCQLWLSCGFWDKYYCGDKVSFWKIWIHWIVSPLIWIGFVVWIFLKDVEISQTLTALWSWDYFSLVDLPYKDSNYGHQFIKKTRQVIQKMAATTNHETQVIHTQSTSKITSGCYHLVFVPFCWSKLLTRQLLQSSSSYKKRHTFLICSTVCHDQHLEMIPSYRGYYFFGFQI